MSLRRIAKVVVFGACWLIVMPLAALSWIEKVATRSEGVFSTIAELLSLLPGPFGSYLRVAFYSTALDACSWEVHVGFGSVFTHRGARIARRVSLGAYCVIGHVDIERDVRIASRVSVPSGKRQHLNDDGTLSDGTRFERVSIGAESWLGEGAVILADVGARCIVSAGAVVVNQVPGGCIVGGNPARVLKS
jgi:acetyltransferase-like isoleucine patch superfamily enzyme